MTTETAVARRTGETDTRAIRLTIPAKAEYITLGRLALTGLSRLRPLGEETLADLKLALTEACSNSIRHAYGDAAGGHVDIRYELLPDRLFHRLKQIAPAPVPHRRRPLGRVDDV